MRSRPALHLTRCLGADYSVCLIKHICIRGVYLSRPHIPTGFVWFASLRKKNINYRIGCVMWLRFIEKVLIYFDVFDCLLQYEQVSDLFFPVLRQLVLQALKAIFQVGTSILLQYIVYHFVSENNWGIKWR